jgi:hypothetical protein
MKSRKSSKKHRSKSRPIHRSKSSRKSRSKSSSKSRSKSSKKRRSKSSKRKPKRGSHSPHSRLGNLPTDILGSIKQYLGYKTCEESAAKTKCNFTNEKEQEKCFKYCLHNCTPALLEPLFNFPERAFFIDRRNRPRILQISEWKIEIGEGRNDTSICRIYYQHPKLDLSLSLLSGRTKLYSNISIKEAAKKACDLFKEIKNDDGYLSSIHVKGTFKENIKSLQFVRFGHPWIQPPKLWRHSEHNDEILVLRMKLAKDAE